MNEHSALLPVPLSPPGLRSRRTAPLTGALNVICPERTSATILNGSATP